MSGAPIDFFYVSDTKLDWLYDRFPQSWWRRALGRISGANITILGFGGGASVHATEKTRMQKLRWVEHRLNESDEVGSVDQPKHYFAGRIAMYYGAFDMVDPPVMYLVGESDRTIVALGGSLHHVRGRSVESTRAREDAKRTIFEPEVARAVRRAQTSVDSLPTFAAQRDQQWAIDVAETYWHWSSDGPDGPKMMFETLAICDGFASPAPPEISGRMEIQKNVVLGSPIFVARV